jgi:formate-dependent nitrite reductase membrane component NrfD
VFLAALLPTNTGRLGLLRTTIYLLMVNLVLGLINIDMDLSPLLFLAPLPNFTGYQKSISGTVVFIVRYIKVGVLFLVHKLSRYLHLNFSGFKQRLQVYKFSSDSKFNYIGLQTLLLRIQKVSQFFGYMFRRPFLIVNHLVGHHIH